VGFLNAGGRIGIALQGIGDFQIKNIQLTLVGWATREPHQLGGQDAHPTILDNLFLGVPLPN
jgi:hypothetical protein